MFMELGLNWKLEMAKLVYILHIETATKSCSVALSKNGNRTHCVEEHGDAFVHGEKLALFIKQVLTDATIQPSDLSAISISSGPGSYTGLRIGVSVAKGMCFALSIPLISINTLQSFEKCARIQHPTLNTICVMIDARRMEVFSALFDQDGTFLKTTSAEILDEVSYKEFEPFTCVGDGSAKMKEFWNDRAIQFIDNCHLSAVGQVELAYTKYLNQDFEDVAYFEPNYVKEFYSGS
jgi:tRNA threonylcarbamoyladenosine biosynthesis protein TsaB